MDTRSSAALRNRRASSPFRGRGALYMKEKLRQAERSRNHKLKGGGGAGVEKSTVIKCDGGGDDKDDIVLEVCATSAANDAMASVAAAVRDSSSRSSSAVWEISRYARFSVIKW